MHMHTKQFIGLDVVADAYDEAGCQRVLRKCGRRTGYKQSSPVLLSLSSTSVQIIQFQWVTKLQPSQVYTVHDHVGAHEIIKEPQLPRLRTALRPKC